VQVGRTEIDNTFSAFILDICVADVPFFRNDPIEHLLAGWTFANGQGNLLTKNFKRFANAVAGNAAAYRIDFGGELVDLFADAFILGARSRDAN
jgi:hypothetical protein